MQYLSSITNKKSPSTGLDGDLRLYMESSAQLCENCLLGKQHHDYYDRYCICCGNSTRPYNSGDSRHEQSHRKKTEDEHHDHDAVVVAPFDVLEGIDRSYLVTSSHDNDRTEV